MMDNNEYIFSGSFLSLVSAGLSAAVTGVLALLSLMSVYRAPYILRAEVVPVDTTRTRAS